MAFRVALTFDAEHPDRPTTDGNADRLLDVLASDGIRATFFVQGRWAEAYPRTARRIADAGHLVGNHSHYHARLPLLTPAGLAVDVRAAERAIAEHLGVDPRPWFRCPFGGGAENPELVGRLAGLGYREVDWHVNPEDWNSANTVAGIASFVVQGVTAHGDGAVVLLHAWPDPTAAAVRTIVPRLRQQGATFVGVDELPSLPSFVPANSPTFATASERIP